VEKRMKANGKEPPGTPEGHVHIHACRLY